MTNARMTRQATYSSRAVGTFKNRRDVEAALQDLKNSNIDMDRVSLIARHVDEVEGAEDVGKRGNEAKEGAAAGATAGTVLGGIGGFLVGVGVLAVPGVGPILAAGAGIPALASTLAGAGIGAATGGIVGALVGAGIPEDRAREYSDRVKAGEYLLMINGTETDLQQIQSIMQKHHVENFGIFDAPDLVNAGTAPRTTQDVNQKVTMPDRENRDVVETRDIDKDGEPEVIIVDKHQDAR